MKILHQLDRPNFRASKSDKILMRYIKENANLFCTTPIAILAANCGVSEATITRFVRKMGFNSLQFFKLTLNEELASSKKHLVINSDISCDEPIAVTARKLLAHNISTLEQTAANLDESAIAESVELIKTSSRIFFIGLGNSGFVAEDTAYKFMRIGVNVKGLDNSHMIMLQMALLRENDLVVAVSHSGRSYEIAEALRLARENSAKIILVTSNKNAALIRYADICIFYETGEPILETETVSTKITQIFILDLIYTQIVKQTMELAAAFKHRTAEAINTLRLKNEE